MVQDLSFLKDAKLITSIFNTFSKGSALIAGGCLRDHLTNRTQKDIDILVKYSDERDINEAIILANRLGYHIDRNIDPSFDEDDLKHHQLKKIITINKEYCLPIDIIFLTVSPMERIMNFPSTSSEIWLEGDDLKWTEEFQEFLDDGVAYLNKNTLRQDYLTRMEEYYPDCEFIFKGE